MITTINEYRSFLEKVEIDLVKLEQELNSFRTQLENDNEWIESKECFKGTCQNVTDDLEIYLKDLGYNAIRVRGYYKNANNEFYPNITNWDFKDQEIFSKQYYRNGETCEGLKFPHWWIEIDNKYIVDLTEDQFHPGEEDEYRIGIYKKPDSNYKRI